MSVFIATLNVSVERGRNEPMQTLQIYVEYPGQKSFDSSCDEQYGDIADDISEIILTKLGKEWSQCDVDTDSFGWFTKNNAPKPDIVVTGDSDSSTAESEDD